MDFETVKNAILNDVIVFFNEKIKNYARGVPDINLCTDSCRPRLMKTAEWLQQKYRYLSLKDSYITVVYTYFCLQLAEPTEDFMYLNKCEYNRIADDPKMIKLLFFKITTSQLLDDNKKDLSSKIRRTLFGMDEVF